MPAELQFLSTGEGKPARWLKVTEGCYVRVRDISVVSTGVSSSADGSEVAPPLVVAVHMTNGSYAAFEPCASPGEAAAMSGTLVAALEELEDNDVDA